MTPPLPPRRAVRFLLLLLPVLLLGAACAPAAGGSAAPDTPGEPLVVTDAATARAALGRTVSLSGTAGNAKLSAVIVRGDLLVYLPDRESWPDDLVGTTVTVRGTLEETAALAATRGPDGAVSAGTDGPVFVLRGVEP